MAINPAIKRIDDRESVDLADKYRLAVQLRNAAPKQSEGVAGSMVIVDNGSEARLYIKGKKQWWYIDLDKE